jgi:hypothetical protein
MKIFVLGLAMSGLLITACNNNQKATATTGADTSSRQAANAPEPKDSGKPLEKVLNGYLQLKNALSKDDDKDAAEAGKGLVQAMASLDSKSLSGEQAKVFQDVADDIKEHAEHIGANAGNIKHQREHFETLSQDMYDLVKAGNPTGDKLYYDHCPMYNKGKGANWVSEKKEIENPYMGKEMLSCGTVKEELN